MRSTSCRCSFRPFANSPRPADAAWQTTAFRLQAPTDRFVPTAEAPKRQTVRLEMQDRLMAAETADRALHALQYPRHGATSFMWREATRADNLHRGARWRASTRVERHRSLDKSASKRCSSYRSSLHRQCHVADLPIQGFHGWRRSRAGIPAAACVAHASRRRGRPIARIDVSHNAVTDCRHAVARDLGVD